MINPAAKKAADDAKAAIDALLALVPVVAEPPPVVEPPPPEPEPTPTPTPDPEPTPIPEPDPEPVPVPTSNPLDPLAESRAIIALMQPGEFKAVSKNTMMDVAPARADTAWLVVGPMAVLEAWGGAAYDTDRECMVFNGGGHNDYGGNEVYEWSVKTLSWVRATNPSPMQQKAGQPDGIMEITDGTESPLSNHSYDGLCYVPTIKRTFLLPQATARTGTGYDGYAYQYDGLNRTWKRGAKAPMAAPNVGCEWHEASQRVIASEPNGLQAWSPATDSWAALNNWDDQGFGRGAAIDQDRSLFVQIGPDGTKPLVYFDLKNTNGPGPSGPRRTAPTVTGSAEFRAQSPACGIAWHPVQKRFFIWAGGPDVWAVDQAWESVKYAGNGPAYLGGYNGIYGKWQYCPLLDVFIGVRKGNEPVYFYKPPPVGAAGVVSTGSTPTTTPSQVMATAKSGTTVALPKGMFNDAFVIPSTLSDVTILAYGTTLKGAAAEQKAAIVNYGTNIRIEGIEVLDVRGSGNSAAIYHGGKNLTLHKVHFKGCEMNVRSNNGDRGLFHIDKSILEDSVGSDQLGHNIYVSRIDGEFRLTDSKVIGAGRDGHVIKSRAAKTTVTGNVIAQLDRVSSAPIDVPEGGQVTIARNFIEQGTYFDISPVVVNYGREVGQFTPPLTEWPGELVIDSNAIVSDYVSPDGRIGPRGTHLAVLVLGKGVNVARVRNNRIVYMGDPMKMVMTWADRTPERIVENVGNQFFTGRAAAGLQPYPALN